MVTRYGQADVPREVSGPQIRPSRWLPAQYSYYICWRNGSSLLKVMVCYLWRAKPLSKSVLAHHRWEHNKHIQWKYHHDLNDFIQGIKKLFTLGSLPSWSRERWVNSLVPSRCGNNYISVFFKDTLWIDTLVTYCEIGLWWVPLKPTDDKSTLVQEIIFLEPVLTQIFCYMLPLGHNELNWITWHYSLVIAIGAGNTGNCRLLGINSLCTDRF